MIKQTYNKLLTGCVSFVKSSCKPSMECFQTCLWSTLGDKPHEFVSFNAIFPYFPERCVVFFFHWASRVMSHNLNMFFYLHQTTPYEAMVRMPSPTSVSLSACALACERRLVCFFWRSFGCSTRWFGNFVGDFFVVFCSTEIQWWLGWFEELEPEILGKLRWVIYLRWWQNGTLVQELLGRCFFF